MIMVRGSSRIFGCALKIHFIKYIKRFNLFSRRLIADGQKSDVMVSLDIQIGHFCNFILTPLTANGKLNMSCGQ